MIFKLFTFITPIIKYYQFYKLLYYCQITINRKYLILSFFDFILSTSTII